MATRVTRGEWPGPFGTNESVATVNYAALLAWRAPNGIRTRAAALKGRCPRPLDDGGAVGFGRLGRRRPAVGTAPAYGKTQDQQSG